jgi:hypothetical protein
VAGSRFVLRYQGEGARPEADVARIRGLGGASIVDESSSRLLLVDAEEERLRELVGSMPDWVMAPEQTFAVPDTRKRVERPPG